MSDRRVVQVGAGLRQKEREGRVEGRSKGTEGKTREAQKAEAERGIRQSRGSWSQMRSTPAVRRPLIRAVVAGLIPTSSAPGARPKTSLVPESWRWYSCNRSSRGHIGTQAPPDAGDVFSLSEASSKESRCEGQLETDGEGNQGGQWRRGMLMCTQETHNEQERRRGQHAEQGVS